MILAVLTLNIHEVGKQRFETENQRRRSISLPEMRYKVSYVRFLFINCGETATPIRSGSLLPNQSFIEWTIRTTATTKTKEMDYSKVAQAGFSFGLGGLTLSLSQTLHWCYRACAWLSKCGLHVQLDSVHSY